MLPHLSAEIILLILRQRVTLPFTHPIAADSPSAVEYQSELAKWTLVCKLWHSLAAPLLYRAPIVYSLPLFIVGMDNPPIEGLKTKRELLARVERLFLHSSLTPLKADDTPEEVIRAYSKDCFDDDLAICVKNLERKRIAEELLEAWQKLRDDPISTSDIFPLLRTLSTDTLTEGRIGSRTPISSIGTGHFDPLGFLLPSATSVTLRDAASKVVPDCQNALADFIRGTNSIAHYCGSGRRRSLLGLRDEACHAPTSGNFPSTISTHLTPPMGSLPRLHLGRSTRYYLQNLEGCYGEHDAVRICVRFSVGPAIARRRTLALEGSNHVAGSSAWDITGGLYLGPSQAEEVEWRAEEMSGADLMSAEIAKMAELVRSGKEGLPEGMVVNDDFEVKPIAEAPMCEACGWSGGLDGGRNQEVPVK